MEGHGGGADAAVQRMTSILFDFYLYVAIGLSISSVLFIWGLIVSPRRRAGWNLLADRGVGLMLGAHGDNVPS